MMQIISSKDNELIKHIKKLNDRKYRDETNQFVIEGMKLITEAIIEKASIYKIIICENCEISENISKEMMYEIAKYDCVYVTDKVFKSITGVNTPQGILAIIDKKEQEQEIDYKQDIIIVLDNIQDPGNMGTILRTVDSVGLNQVLISKGSVDCYNSKVVRSTMGAIFRVNIIECEDLLATLKKIKKHKFKIAVTSLQTEKSIYDIDYKNKVIVIGNESNGVRNEIQQMADTKMKIPMIGKTESLNASVATGIVLYEYIRQRFSTGDRPRWKKRKENVVI